MGTGVGSLYYHFANKEALLAELAADGFRELRRAIVAAVRTPRHRTPFHAACDAYLGFTRRRPTLYALMYNERVLANHEVARLAEAEAFEAFQLSLQEFGVPAGEVEDVALTFWVIGRGIAAVSAATLNGHPGAAKEIVRRVTRGLDALIGEPVKTRQRN
jgi:AcrR family transcriptional regulator